MSRYVYVQAQRCTHPATGAGRPSVCVRGRAAQPAAAGGQQPVNLDEPRQDPAEVAGGLEPHSVPLSGVPLF